MNHHHTSFVPVADLMSRRDVLEGPSEIVKEMAECLAAGVMFAKLDLDDDIDVIEAIRAGLPHYRWKMFKNHIDDAIAECRQILNATAMTEG